MMRNVIAAALLAAALAGPLHAAVVFDGGGPDGRDGLFANNFYVFSAAATRFSLAAPLSFSGLSWWGGYAWGGGPDADDDFTFELFAADASLPGVRLGSFHLGSGNRSATGNLVAGFLAEYGYSASLAPTTLGAGTYFASLSNNYWGSDNWFWETTSGGQQLGGAVSFDLWNSEQWIVAEDWESGPTYNLAFQLTGEAPVANSAPEPGSLALLGLAWAGLGSARRMTRSATT